LTALIRSFVVRIYRRHGRGGLDGVVEDVATGRSRPFHSIAELWAALRGTRRSPGRKDAPSVSPTAD
jgi:hypothetical protein